MENESKEKAIVVTHLNDIFQEKGDELLPVIASSAQIINFLNYMNSPLPNNELETIITKLTTLTQQSPYVGKILTEYPINNNKTTLVSIQNSNISVDVLDIEFVKGINSKKKI